MPQISLSHAACLCGELCVRPRRVQCFATHLHTHAPLCAARSLVIARALGLLCFRARRRQSQRLRQQHDAHADEREEAGKEGEGAEAPVGGARRRERVALRAHHPRGASERSRPQPCPFFSTPIRCALMRRRYARPSRSCSCAHARSCTRPFTSICRRPCAHPLSHITRATTPTRREDDKHLRGRVPGSRPSARACVAVHAHAHAGAPAALRRLSQPSRERGG